MLASSKAYVLYDLGESKPVSAVFLQADNDDDYIVAGSADGQSFRPLLSSTRVQGVGLRPRSVKDLNNETARYIRLSARGGDGAYAVSELQVFSTTPEVFPPELERRDGTPIYEGLHPKIVLFGVALCLFLLLSYRGAPRWARLGIVLPLAATSYLLYEMWPIRPLPLLEQSLLRATIAAVALFALVREAWASERARADTRAILGVFSLLSVFAVSSYYNLFVPQFRDHAAEKLLFVHPFDMRVYFPVAKYFDELRFDGVYFASAGAYLEDQSANADSLSNVEIRDLRDHKMRRIGEVADAIREVKTRFSPERWESFKKDMRYFSQAMGKHDYLWSLTDHGGNATPVWLLAGKLLFSHVQASTATLFAAALLDPILLAILFGVVWRTFGLRTMLMSVVVFGATDFYMFGSDFAGSTLRQDWIVAVGLGACALKKQRWVLGGGLLAYGGLIRAFPATGVVFLAAPLAAAILEHYFRNKRLPTWKTLRDQVRPLGLAWAGAAGTVAVLVILSALVFPSGTWSAWLYKVQLLSKDAHLNHIGWRTIIMFDPSTTLQELSQQNGVDWQQAQFGNYADRWPLYYAGVAAFACWAILSCRKKALWEAALTGLLFIPVIFYPANYYCHFVFLLPMLTASAFEERKGMAGIWGWALLLGVCVAQYSTLEHGNTDLCFVGQSAILLTAFVLLLGPDALASYRALRAKPEELSASATPPTKAGDGGAQTP